MTITLVQQAIPASQSTNALYTATTTPQATFGATPTQHNLIVAALIPTSTSGSITPGNGLAATDKSPYVGTHSVPRPGLYWKEAGASEGTTFGFTTVSTDGTLVIQEWNLGGSPVYDVGGSAERSTTGTGLSVPTDSAIAIAEELALVLIATGGGDGGNFSWSTFTSRFEAFNGGFGSRVTAGVGVITATPTWVSSVFASGIVGTWRLASTGRPKAYVGGVWTPKPLKHYDGAAWVEKPVKHWNGSAWVALS